MPKLIRSNKPLSIADKVKEIDTFTGGQFFHYVPSNFKRDKELAYTVLYMEAKKHVGNPKDIVKLAKEIPQIWNPALAVVQARQNQDKLQSIKMLKLVKQGLLEAINALKSLDKTRHFASLQVDPEPEVPQAKTPMELQAEEDERDLYLYRKAKIEARNRKGKNPWD